MRRGIILICCGVAIAGCADQGWLTDDEWSRVQSLSNLPDPVGDPSNKYVGNAAAELLGQKFYFDPQFSGTATAKDTLGRDMPIARAAAGADVNISCNTCHQVSRGGTDHTSVPSSVSIGAGAYDVNAPSSLNAAYYKLNKWNGRNDSLWSQIVVSENENSVSMNSNRLKDFWRIADGYSAAYNAVFTQSPLPSTPTLAAQVNRIDTVPTSPTFGQCKVSGPGCGTAECIEEVDAGIHTCWPRWPLQGKPGETPGCQRGDPDEPFGDAFDCMAANDAKAITVVYVNFAKAIAAYEYTLISRNSAFDKYVAAGPDSDEMSSEAIRGARLFVGKASCIDCHNTPLFSDAFNNPTNLEVGFHNDGVPQVGPYVPSEADCPDGGGLEGCDCVVSDDPVHGPADECLPWGLEYGLDELKQDDFRRIGDFSDAPSDTSRSSYYFEDEGTPIPFSYRDAWKTPSLRDAALTGPYMHNGMFASLRDVIWYYNQGGMGNFEVSGEVDPRIRPLGLTDSEIDDLVAFLVALTGEPLPANVTLAPDLPAETAFP